MRRSLIVVNSVLGIAVVGAAAIAYEQVNSPAQASASSVRTTTVRQSDVTATVSATGNTASAKASNLSFTSSGEITAIYVKVGQKVKKGQKLAKIDPSDAQAALTTAKQALASAKAQLTQAVASASSGSSALQVKSAKLSLSNAETSLSQAKQQLADDTTTQNALVEAAEKQGNAVAVTAAKNNRKQTLTKDEQAVTQAEQQVASAELQVEQQQASASTSDANAASQVTQAKAGVTTAQTNVDTAEDTLAETTLTAPQAGTVLSIANDVGDTVSTSSSSAGAGGDTTTSSTSSSAFMVISDLTTMEVSASVAEADAPSVKVGQQATVTFSATSKTMTGKVTAIGLTGTTSSNVVTYPMTVTLVDVPAGIKLNASVSLTITTGSASNVLYVPTAAVTTNGTRHTVTVLENGVQTVTEVTTGVVGNSSTQIKSGVKAGQTVVLTTTTTSSSSTTNGFPGGGPGGGGGFGGGPN